MNRDPEKYKKRRDSVRSDRQLTTDKLPPHSVEAEQGVLGCCLLSPAECLGDAVEALKQPEAFYEVRHQIIFRVLLEKWEAQQPIDLITVTQKLKDTAELEGVGGVAYIASLSDTVPSAAHLPYYLEIVREKDIARRIIRACNSAVAGLYESEESIDEQLDTVEREFLKISEDRVSKREQSMREIIANEVIPQMEEYHRGGPQMAGLPTGFVYLDRMICGMAGGDMIVIAARPGAGKTSLIMNIAEHLAVSGLARKKADGTEEFCKIPVGVFSLEMTNKSLGARLLFQHAKADYQRFRTGYMQGSDIPKLTSASGRVAHSAIWIDDTPGITLLDLRARARRWHRQYGIRLFIIDYLQLMKPGRYYENREKEVAEISNGIKVLAKELNVPIIVAAQMNRRIEDDPKRLPQLSDLRESGSIEQDADTVWFLYEPHMKEEKRQKFDERMTHMHGTDWSDKLKPVNLLIAKQRNGPTGVVELVYLKASMRFESAWHAPKEEAAAPQRKVDKELPSREELGL